MAAVAHLTLDLVRAAAREVAEAYALDLVVLFGSAAREGFAEARDVDLAVTGDPERGRPAEGWGWGREFVLYAAFTQRLGVEVDLVEADRASDILQAHVARDGMALYERTPGAFAQFQEAANRRFEAMQPQREAEWEETKRGIRALLPAEPDYRRWGEAR